MISNSKLAAILYGGVFFCTGTLFGLFIQAQRQVVTNLNTSATSTETAAASAQSSSVNNAKPNLPDAILKGFKREADNVRSPMKEKKYREEAIKAIRESNFGNDLACLMELTDGKYSMEDVTFSDITKVRETYIIFVDTKLPSLKANGESIKVEVNMKRENLDFGKYIISDNSYFVDGNSFSENPRLTSIRGAGPIISTITECLINQDVVHLPKQQQEPDTATIQPPDRKSVTGVTGVQRPAVGAATASQ